MYVDNADQHVAKIQPADPNTVEGRDLINKRREDKQRREAGEICLNTYATVDQQLSMWQE